MHLSPSREKVAPSLNKRRGGNFVSSSRIHFDSLFKKVQPSFCDAPRGSTSLALPSVISMVTDSFFALRLRLTFIGKGNFQVGKVFLSCEAKYGGNLCSDS